MEEFRVKIFLPEAITKNLYADFLIAIMRLSIVSTLYNSAPHLIEFYERITQCAQDITHDYELILVNDGSSDNSFELAVSFHEKDQRVKDLVAEIEARIKTSPK